MKEDTLITTSASMPGGEGFLPTGSTLLNLALADNPYGGWQVGSISNLVGDSGAGKTFVALSSLAEMACDENYDDYRLIYDDVERANGFNMQALFGDGFEERIEAPAYDDNGIPVYSDTVQDMEMYIHNAIDNGEPFIYVVDSLDALTSVAEAQKTQENLARRRKEQAEKGSYGMDKPKEISRILRETKAALKNTKSSVIVVSQVRDNINPMSFSSATRSGGRALKFYSIHEVWLAKSSSFKKTYNKITRETGVSTRVRVKKNKVTGKSREIEFPIFYDYGIDDILSCITFLTSTKYWKTGGRTIKATELGLEGTTQTLINKIEEEGLEESLKKITANVWFDIEKNVSTNKDRKPKYKRKHE